MFCWLDGCECEIKVNKCGSNLHAFVHNFTFYQLSVKMWVRPNQIKWTRLIKKRGFFIKVTTVELWNQKNWCFNIIERSSSTLPPHLPYPFCLSLPSQHCQPFHVTWELCLTISRPAQSMSRAAHATMEQPPAHSAPCPPSSPFRLRLPVFSLPEAVLS